MSTKFKLLVNTLAESAWSRLLPTPCTLCADPTTDGEIICRPCQTQLPTNPVHCPRCALPLPATQPNSAVCGQCLRKPPAFDSALAPLIYAPPVSHLISQLKYHRRLATGQTFARLIGQRVAALEQPLPDAIIPVPLHRQRLRQRGFNQSVEIARPLAKLINRPLLINQAERHKITAPQTGLSGPARRKNLRGAFTVNSSISQRRVALIDDVMTTGSTASELATTLKKAGVAEVAIWVVARVTDPRR